MRYFLLFNTTVLVIVAPFSSVNNILLIMRLVKIVLSNSRLAKKKQEFVVKFLQICVRVESFGNFSHIVTCQDKTFITAE